MKKKYYVLIGIAAIVASVQIMITADCLGSGGIPSFFNCTWINVDGQGYVPAKTASASEIIDSNNRFALKFYSEIVKDSDENIFFSPWSVATAFAIAYEGARGDTAQEIRTVFEFPQDDTLRRSLFQAIQNDLNADSSDYSLNTANALWVKEDYEIKQGYIDTAKSYYGSQVDNVDFVSNDGVNKINEWVSSKTQGKIKRLLEIDSTDALTRLIITNAIYFQGEWEYQFNPSFTQQRDFYISKNQAVKVPMMELEWKDWKMLNYAENELLEILELPYKGGKISMLILLPKDIDGIRTLEENLTTEKLFQWKENLSETTIAVFLPKFTAQTEYDLNDRLQQMGMTIPFDEFRADFSGINEVEPLYIGKAVHKAFVDVNEVGTEAAAATGIEARLQSGPPAVFKADHPFIFLIQDNETGQILFMGRVVDPTQ
ncbi:MAG TPA: serpin family protein [Candidatus Nitrosotenuis sp.]|jgi:serpin B|uniref:Uncharacterized serpin-like protein MM_2675 n=1 Tax=Candidatus Nitrosotenuis uzonensis TaxID=1407055 RepID=A0A812EVZ0_9ARCH|nr:serpin family protein [Candidatus Nitrosotenuis uzonensis]CAE6485560.1 Uncharacterized serpin-like protein MM_2675 [Candidatus Nitrosotenuis uzonensis]HXG14583.1 serpin family protein [Candidatus Nitrosotenuis sp.]